MMLKLCLITAFRDVRLCASILKAEKKSIRAIRRMPINPSFVWNGLPNGIAGDSSSRHHIPEIQVIFMQKNGKHYAIRCLIFAESTAVYTKIPILSNLPGGYVKLQRDGTPMTEGYLNMKYQRKTDDYVSGCCSRL